MTALPSGWAELELDGLTEPTAPICYGVLKPGERDPHGIPMVRVTDIRGDVLDLSALMKITPKLDMEFARSRVKAGDVIISVQGTVGRVAVIPENTPPTNISRTIARVRPVDRRLTPWVWAALRSPDVQRVMDDMTGGTTRDSLNIGTLRTVPIPVAPLAEQRRIVAKLAALTARTARARADLDRVPAMAARYREAILDAAFRGDLTADLRGDEQDSGEELRARLLNDRQARLRELHGKAKNLDKLDFAAEGNLPQLPHSWTWMPVDALATKVADGVHKKPEYVETGVPFLTVRNLTAGPGISFAGCRYVTEADHLEFCKRTAPEDGDILITKDGTLGVVRAIRTTTPFSIFVSLALVKPVDRGMSDYLELAFQAPVLQEQMGGVGSGLQHIHLTDLRRDMVPVAPAEERQEIVRRARRALAELDRLTADAAAARRLLDRLDQAILAKAFRGELVTQDPADEPASVLLDRIRAERASAPPKARRARKTAPI